MLVGIPVFMIGGYKKKKNNAISKEQVVVIYNKNIFILYQYVEGHEPGAKDTARVGELIGMLHKTMKKYPYRLTKWDKYFFIDRYIEILKGRSYSKADLFREHGNKLWSRVGQLPVGYCFIEE